MRGLATILAVTVNLLISSPVVSDDTFSSPTQFLAELAHLNETISVADTTIAQSIPRREREELVLEGLNAQMQARIESALALQDAIAAKHAAGESAVAETRQLNDLEIVVVDLARQSQAAAADRDRFAGDIGRASAAKARAEARRLTLLARYRAALAPVYLRAVRIVFTDPRDSIEAVPYDAAWSVTEADATNDRVIAQLVAALEDLDNSIAEIEEKYRQTEQRFIAADRQWQDRNADYITSVAVVATGANILLETGDAAVGVAMAGPGWPAALAFEAIYRPAEAIYKGKPASSLPQVSDEIILAREQLSTSYGLGVLVAGTPGSRPNPQGGFGPALYVEEKAEAIKSVYGIGYAGLAESVAQAAVPYFRDAAEAGADSGWQKLALSLAGPNARPFDLYKALGGTTREEAADFAVVMARIAEPTLVDGLITTMRKRAFWADVGKGVATGLVLTIAKEGVKQLNRDEAQEIFEDLARIELEWFVRQRALQTVSYILQLHREVQRGLTLALSQAIATRETADEGRRLIVARSDRMVLSDWQLGKGVFLELSFSERLLTTRFGFGTGALHLSGGSLASHNTRLTREIIGDAGAPVGLMVEARPDGAWELHDGYDADPGTLAALQPDGTWLGREFGTATKHSMTFASPLLSVLGDPQRLRVGVAFEVAYRAPSNADDGAWIGLVSPGVTPREMPPQAGDGTRFAMSTVAGLAPDANGSEGVVSLTPDAAGRYEIRMYDRNRLGVAVAAIAVCVIGMAEPCDEPEVVDPVPASCVPGAAPASRVASTFAGTSDGWTLAGDAGPEPELAGGGVQGKDREGGSVWYWVAPSKFLGDQAGAYGGRLTYRLRVTAITRLFAAEDIVMESDDGTRLSVQADGYPPGQNWTDYSYPLDPSGGWRVVGTGELATAGQICQVLSTLVSLKIRGEYETGPDTGWLGGVSLGN